MNIEFLINRIKFIRRESFLLSYPPYPVVELFFNLIVPFHRHHSSWRAWAAPISSGHTSRSASLLHLWICSCSPSCSILTNHFVFHPIIPYVIDLVVVFFQEVDRIPGLLFDSPSFFRDDPPITVFLRWLPLIDEVAHIIRTSACYIVCAKFHFSGLVHIFS